MNDVFKVFKIDNISIRPYLSKKNFLIFSIIILIVMIATKSAFTILYMLFFLMIMYQSYPFLLSEDYGLEMIYRMFGISNKDVVKGRYLWAIVNGVIVLLFGILISIIFSKFFKENDIDNLEFLSVAVTYYWIYLLMISIQYPLMFKLDYKKSRQYSIFPLLLIFIVVVFSLKVVEIEKIIEYIMENLKLFSILAILLIVVIISISIILSNKFYDQKEI
ncbi:MAG: ABC-2 transporter permease [Anaerococcus sp.]